MDIVYGADVPSVGRKVEKHLSMKVFGDNDKTGRYYFDFDEMVPDERAEYERLKAIEDVSSFYLLTSMKNVNKYIFKSRKNIEFVMRLK